MGRWIRSWENFIKILPSARPLMRFLQKFRLKMCGFREQKSGSVNREQNRSVFSPEKWNGNGGVIYHCCTRLDNICRWQRFIASDLAQTIKNARQFTFQIIQWRWSSGFKSVDSPTYCITVMLKCNHITLEARPFQQTDSNRQLIYIYIRIQFPRSAFGTKSARLVVRLISWQRRAQLHTCHINEPLFVLFVDASFWLWPRG